MSKYASGITKLKIPTYDYTPAPGWSYSRNKTLRECLRKYWFTYYGKKYADPAIREKIIKIKHLVSLPLVLGEILHQSIAQALENLKETGVCPAMETMISVSEKALEKSLETRQFIEENGGGGINSCKVTAAMQRLHESIGNFYSHPLLPQIISSIIERPEYVLIDPSGYGECRIEGKKAFAKTDLIYSSPEGSTIIVDWKLSNGHPMENLTQLSGYLYYAMNVLHQPLANLQARMIYLSSQEDDLILTATQEKAELIKSRILAELKNIEDCCIDPLHNIPQPMEYFSKKMNPSICSYCKYRHLCRECT